MNPLGSQGNRFNVNFSCEQKRYPVEINGMKGIGRFFCTAWLETAKARRERENSREAATLIKRLDGAITGEGKSLVFPFGFCPACSDDR